MENFRMIPGILALLLSAACYFLSFYALCLVSWTIVVHALPPGTRLGLRLAAVLIGEFLLNAILVQTIGLIGYLRAEIYFALTLVAGGAVSWWFRACQPHNSLWALLRRNLELWIGKAPFGLGCFSFGCLLYLVYRSSLVEGMDSLSIHGPLVVSWLQAEKVELLWHWNYPLCWEYQFVPNFLFLRSDVLVVIPRLLSSLALLLLLREIGRRLRLPGSACQLIAWLCTLTPLLWGIQGEGSMKNDTAFALGMLISVLALDRSWRNRPGGFWLIQLGSFMLLGTKATGAVYAIMFLGITLVPSWIRHPVPSWRVRLRKTATLIGITALLQATPCAVQAANFIKNGNPFHPLGLKFGEIVIFPGNMKHLGTSLLAHSGELDFWPQLFRGSALRTGLEFPVLGVVFIVASIHLGTKWMQARARRRKPNGQERFLMYLLIITGLFWIMFAATPWSAGTHPDSIQYVTRGRSLRYAIAPVGLTTLLSVSYLSQVLGRRKVYPGLFLAFLVLLYHKWRPALDLWHGSEGVDVFLWSFGAVLFLASGALLLGQKLWARMAPAINYGDTFWGISIAFGLLLLVPIFGALVENRRETAWGDASDLSASYRPIWEYVSSEVPVGAIIATNEKQALFRYFLFGPQLKNRVHAVSDPLAGGRVEVPAGCNFYYLSYHSPKIKRLRSAVEVMRRQGWRQVAAAKRGALLTKTDVAHRRPGGRAGNHDPGRPDRRDR